MINRSTWLIILSVLILVIPDRLQAQKVITLKECYESAVNTNPLAGEKKAYSGISELKQKNISAGWYPTLDLNATALYNSDVVDLGKPLGSLPLPGIADAINPLPHDQYKVTIDINQVIYDGGAAKNAKVLEDAELRVNEKQTDSDLYKLKAQINSYYFNILLLERQAELLNNYLELIGKRLNSAESAVENGVMLKSDADVLLSEMLNIRQQLSENEIRGNSMRMVLSDLTGIPVNPETVLEMPEEDQTGNQEISRPELQLFDMRIEQLNAGEAMIQSKRAPKAFGFATLGYGNPPGSNFFLDEFDTYYIIGAGLKWNIFDWNKAKNEKQIISIQKNMLENRKEDLSDNIKRQLEIKKSEISNLQKLTETDIELAEIRRRITASAESQHQNGTITATEYLNILNSEKQVMINAEIHKINLALARTEYLNIRGTDF